MTKENPAKPRQSNAVPYNVAPCTYTVIFDKMHCLSTNDDDSFSDPDEIATTWVIVADDYAWSKQSATYEGFTRAFGEPVPNFPYTEKAYNSTDRLVFKPSTNENTGGQVEKGLFIRTMLLEIDGDDLESTTDTIGFIADVTEKILAATGNGQYIPLVELGVKIVSYVISFFSDTDNDNLGERDIILTPNQLQMLTNNSSRTYSNKLQFLNGDEGSYELFYRVIRKK